MHRVFGKVDAEVFEVRAAGEMNVGQRDAVIDQRPGKFAVRVDRALLSVLHELEYGISVLILGPDRRSTLTGRVPAVVIGATDQIRPSQSPVMPKLASPVSPKCRSGCTRKVTL